jgi:RsmE family RNA methyltransferase
VNLVLLHPPDLDGDVATLTGRRGRHIREVHRVAAGDTLTVGLVDGMMGNGTVLMVTDDEVRLRVSLDRAPAAPPGVDLLLAMPRPKTLRKVLAGATAMGVKRVVLVNAARVEKSYFDSPLLHPDELREELVLGLEQARDTAMPEVVVRERFRPFIEDEAPVLWGDARRLVAHPNVDGPIERCDVGDAVTPAVVAIGPEGGWVPFELGLFEAQGFQSFTLGERILRVETATMAVLAQLMLVRRLRGGAATRGDSSRSP